MMLVLFSQEAKARSLEEIFAEGQVIFQAMYMADTEPLDAFQKRCARQT